MEFLGRHARKLLELNVPRDIGPIISPELENFSAIPFRLERLNVTPRLFFSLAQCLKGCEELSVAKISNCYHPRQHALIGQSQPEFGDHPPRDTLKDFPSVHTLTMGICINAYSIDRTGPSRRQKITGANNVPLEFEHLPKAFPNLRSLYINVRRGVCAGFVYPRAYDCNSLHSLLEYARGHLLPDPGCRMSLSRLSQLRADCRCCKWRLCRISSPRRRDGSRATTRP